MKPQDVIILLKIIAMEHENWTQLNLAQSLKISQSEISESIARARYAGLMDESGKEVMKQKFMDFLQYGLAVVFPVQPGAVVRGVRTAHAAPPLSNELESDEMYVWPWSIGQSRGHSITPLYATLPEAVLHDPEFYEWIALTDALRIGRARERNLALEILKTKMYAGQQIAT